jgi:hypothetical protein
MVDYYSLGQSEINQLDVAGLMDQDIFWLEVSVNYVQFLMETFNA